jgi:CHASE1-domain containing sensor protein
MTAARSSMLAPRLLLLLLPWLILVATLGATWFVWNHERQNADKALHSQFEFALRDTVSRIEQRVAAYEQLLRGVQGLFATTGLRNRQAIREYVETLRLDPNFSGMFRSLG